MDQFEKTLQPLLHSEEPLLLKALAQKYSDVFSKTEISRINKNALNHPNVQYWITKLHCDYKLSALHGSFDSCFENTCGKCLQFGFTVHDALFKDKIEPFRQWYLALIRTKKDIKIFCPDFYLNILAYHLFRAGYEDKEIIDQIRNRVKQLYSFVVQDRYDLAVPSEGFPSIPKNFQKKPLVDPKLFLDGMSVFPNIHDLIGLQSYYIKTPSEHEKKQIDRVVQYISDPRYQTIHEGYGVMFVSPRSYYGIGWSCHFLSHNQLLGYSICSTFPAYRNSLLSQEMNQKWGSFRLSDQLYDFPSEYLQEKTGYLVSGYHMGMGLNRRTKSWKHLESSFWWLLANHHKVRISPL